MPTQSSVLTQLQVETSRLLDLTTYDDPVLGVYAISDVESRELADDEKTRDKIACVLAERFLRTGAGNIMITRAPALIPPPREFGSYFRSSE